MTDHIVDNRERPEDTAGTPLPGRTAVVVGAGISGLCTAYWLREAGYSVTVLEKEGEPGGTMKTVKEGDWLIETGPNSALETTPLLGELFTGVGILPKRRYAGEESSNRYIVRSGRLYPLPMSPLAFLRSNLWSVGGKLRLFGEPFGGRARKEESVAEFVCRRLGKEFLDYAINPFVAGVYAGNPETLSVEHAFPKLHALERTYGGLLVGAIRSRKERKARKETAKNAARLFSFDEGMQVLPLALAGTLGRSVRYNTHVEQIIPQRAGASPIYTIRYTHDGVRATLEARNVILSAPAYATADIIRDIDPGMAQTLGSVYYPPVAEIFLGYRESDIGCRLDGFGFLVPGVEQRRILGCIWSSVIFPGRAPAGHAALTVFVGGARQPELAALDDGELLGLVRKDLGDLMNVRGVPVISKIIRWRRAIPQYTLGYGKTLQAIDRFEQNFRGAYICSNYRKGIAVGDCVMNAKRTVEIITGSQSF